MAKFIQKIEVDVKDTEVFKNLVYLLEKHLDKLPEELQESLKIIYEDGFEDGFEDLDYEDFIEATIHLDEELPVTTSLGVDFAVTKINKVLKRVYYFGKDKSEHSADFPDAESWEKYMDVDHFWIKKGDTIIWEW